MRVGLCGFTIAFDDYLERFPVVEVQQTFYEPPQDATMRRWRDRAPAAFEFTLKAWQLITHDASSPTYRRMKRGAPVPGEVGSFRLTDTTIAGWGRTLECARILRATAVLLQCPRSFRPTPENVERMRRFLGPGGVERPDGVRLLWEPRGPWPADLLRGLCADLDLVHVVDPFVDQTVTPEQTYFRLHGITGARHVYSDDELARLATMLPDPAVATVPAYVMFNELPRVGDATRFIALLLRRD